MPLEIDYCTPQMVTDRLNMTGKTTAAQDALIAQMITSASRFVDRYTGMAFGSDGTPSVPTSRNFRADGTETLSLRPFLWQFVSLNVFSGEGSNAVVTAYDNTMYYLDDHLPIPGKYAPPYSTLVYTGNRLVTSSGLKLVDSWDIPPYGSRVTVSGVWGFYSASAAPAGVPADIQEATAILAGRAWREKDAGLSDTSGTDEMGHQLFVKALPFRTKMVLDTWAGAGL